MSEENKKEPGQNRNTAAVNLEGYRITDIGNAPAEAVALLSLWRGEILYNDYRDQYNKLVDAAQECVDLKLVRPEDAIQRLEKCREF